MKNDMENLSRDIAALYVELDPYGTDAAREYGETETQFIERAAAAGCDIPTMKGDIEELERMIDGDPEYMDRLESIKTRLKHLEA